MNRKNRMFEKSLTLLAGILMGGLWALACAQPQVLEVAVGKLTPGSLQAEPSKVALGVLPHPAFAHAAGASTGKSIADIAQQTIKSVVSVASTKMVLSKGTAMSPFREEPMLRRFFGPPGPSGPRQQRGLGSGVLVTDDGIVLTNNHVVEGAEKIRVTTSDGRELDAEIVGTDPKSDLAVLRLKGDLKGLVPLPFGDSARLRLGDVVLAVGNPFGIGQTVTMGIVSAKGRADVGITHYEDFIQTDAAINPGNSGGALVDMEGRLVGINTAILSRTGGNQGIGFAIPSNMARPIQDALLKHGRVARGWLGIAIQPITAELVKAMGLDSKRGVLVSQVSPESPASRGGMKSGDVVPSVGGTATDTVGQLQNRVAATGAGKTVSISVLRGGKTQRLSVSLGELKAEKPSLSSVRQGPAGEGLRLGALGAKARQRFSIPDSVQRGLVVEAVQPGSLASKAGLRSGDVIVKINRKAVGSVSRFRAALHAAGGKALLLIRRGRESRFVAFGY